MVLPTIDASMSTRFAAMYQNAMRWEAYTHAYVIGGHRQFYIFLVAKLPFNTDGKGDARDRATSTKYHQGDVANRPYKGLS
jgi:hypothetical protein